MQEALECTSVTDFLLYYNPPIGITRELTGSQLKDKDKMALLLSMAGKYGYHIMYMAMNLSKKVKTSYANAPAKLVERGTYTCTCIINC